MFMTASNPENGMGKILLKATNRQEILSRRITFIESRIFIFLKKKANAMHSKTPINKPVIIDVGIV
jgi:hypothetical protein